MSPPVGSAAQFRWLLLSAVLTFVVIALLTLAGGGWLGAVLPRQENRIFRVDGTGPQQIEQAFTANGAWELRWTMGPGGQLHELSYTDNHGLSSRVQGFPQKPLRPHGSMNCGSGGTFHLALNATGPWTIEVFQFPPDHATTPEPPNGNNPPG